MPKKRSKKGFQSSRDNSLERLDTFEGVIVLTPEQALDELDKKHGIKIHLDENYKRGSILK